MDTKGVNSGFKIPANSATVPPTRMSLLRLEPHRQTNTRENRKISRRFSLSTYLRVSSQLGHGKSKYRVWRVAMEK